MPATPISLSRRAALVGSVAALAHVAFVTAAGRAQTPEPALDVTQVPIATLPEFPAPDVRAQALSEQPRVLQFYATWCRLCDNVAPFVAQYATAYRNVVSFRRLDIETEEGIAWALRLQVPFVPTFAVIEPDGKLLTLLYSQDEMLQNAARIARL